MRRVPKDILRLIFEQVGDDQTWRQLSQINRQAYQLGKELLFVEHTVTGVSPLWPHFTEEKYVTKRNGKCSGLQVSIEKLINYKNIVGTNLLKVRVYYTDQCEYIWYDGLKSHKIMANRRSKNIYEYEEIEYWWENRMFIVVCKLQDGTTQRHVFGLRERPESRKG